MNSITEPSPRVETAGLTLSAVTATVANGNGRHTSVEDLVVPHRARPPKEQLRLMDGILLCGDWLVAAIGILVALLVQAAGSQGVSAFPSLLESRPQELALRVLFGASLFSWLMILFGSYESGKVLRMSHWLMNVAKSLGVWPVLILAALALINRDVIELRTAASYSLIAMPMLLICWRFFALVCLLQPRIRAASASRFIVVGWNARIEQLVRALRTDVAEMREFVGCVPTPGGKFALKPPPHIPILGDYSALPELAVSCDATAIILADVSCSAAEIEQLISFCHREYLDFQLVPQYFPALQSRLRVRHVEGVPLLGVMELPLDRTVNRIIKRAIDVVGASIGLVVSTPVILVFGLLVYLESPGAIFYRQVRASRSGRTFNIYKIRSMHPNAERLTGPVWAKRDDPRRLKIGAFMRRMNIDELPQFWNVLKGDMSLVGPRPERPELIERFKREIPTYNVRHEVKAGLTGWAQIKGYRGDTDLHKRLEADLYYLESWNPLLDLYCIAATPFRRSNAH